MKCEICGVRDAKGIFAMITNGHKAARHICPECMQEVRRPGGYTVMLSLLSAVDGYENVTCPNCGRTAAEFTRTGRVGCKECYGAFCEVLEPVLRQMNGTSVPAHEEAGAEDPPAKPVKRIDQLREAMFAAVNAEEYERAAKLRDEIRALQAQEEAE